ncbi:MAG: metallophosphoesterase [Gemmatimonadota bacterium]
MNENPRTGGQTAGRQIRVAVVADVHFDGIRGPLRELFAEVRREADVLAICGDLTTHGEEGQVRGFVEEMNGLDLPVVAVLGNHDHDADQVDEISAILRGRGIILLDGDNAVIEGVGFAGATGFGGGFGRRTLGAFGEKIYKEFVQAGMDEALKLETALKTLHTETRLVLLHYAPIPETLVGEPEQIFPFLGTSRLLPPIDTYGADAVFHGHAHIGSPEGRTPGGTPVFNVASMLLEKTIGRPFRIWTVPAPERRRAPTSPRAE